MKRLTIPVLVAINICGLLNAADVSHARGAQPMPDAATEQALRQTQRGLTNPAERASLLKADPAAQAHDAKVKTMLGSGSEGAYQLSSQLMETLVQKTGGDPVKMQEIVNQMMKDPKTIEQYLTPAQRDQIRRMAGDIESQKGLPRATGSGK